MRQFFTYLADLPPAVNGAAVADENGDYTIYIRRTLSEGARYEVLCHELRHILLGHHEAAAAPGAEARAAAPLLAADIEHIARTGLLPALPLVEHRLIPSPPQVGSPPQEESPPKTSAPTAPTPPQQTAPPLPDPLLDAILADLEALEAHWDTL